MKQLLGFRLGWVLLTSSSMQFEWVKRLGVQNFWNCHLISTMTALVLSRNPTTLDEQMSVGISEVQHNPVYAQTPFVWARKALNPSGNGRTRCGGLMRTWGRRGFPSGSAVKNLPAIQDPQEIQVQSLGQEDPLEENMATHFKILAWRIPRTEKPGRLQSTGWQRVRHDWSKLAPTHISRGGFSLASEERCWGWRAPWAF